MSTFNTKAALLCAFTLSVLSAPVLAEGDKNIMLRAKDGTAQFTGQFLGVENGKIMIESDVLGFYEVAVSRVDCLGAACPDIAQSDASDVVPVSVPLAKP